MNGRDKLTIAKNASANMIRGGATALVAILLPPFLARAMSPDAYGAWALVLQLSAYVAYLDFGIQTAVGRFVAFAEERNDSGHRDRVVNTSLAALVAAGLFGLIALLVLPPLILPAFHGVPSNLAYQMKVALVLVAGSLAVGLPCSVFNGIFVGVQRNEVPAAIIGSTRLVSAGLLIWIARHGGTLGYMGAAVAAVNLFSYFLQYLAYTRLSLGVRFSFHLVDRSSLRELFDYCLSLTIWSFAMLLVTGVDLTLVGIFQFKAVAYYAVAASLVSFIAGLQNAAFNAIISPTATLHSRGDVVGLGRMMITATRYSTLLLLVTGLPLIFAAKSILTFWVGSAYAAHGAVLLQILVAANMVRLTATPYVFTLIGTGEQRLVTLTPLLEAFSNLSVSIIAGYMIGAVGVALGTLFGSFIGVGGTYFYNMRRTRSLQFRLSDYLWNGLLRPFMCAVPVCILILSTRLFLPGTPLATGLAWSVTLVITLACFWRWGLSGAERKRLRFGSPLLGNPRSFDAR